VRFSDVTNPAAGGTIEMVLDGTEGGQMYDNMTVDRLGRVLLQEDVGNNAHLGRIWVYDPATDSLLVAARHNPDFFLPTGPQFITQDEESSGIIDASAILGPGWYLFDVQAHTSAGDPELVERGQFLAMRLGVVAGLHDGELVVLGTAAGDNIDVRMKKGDTVEVRVNGRLLDTFAYADVASITVNAYGGDDRVTIDRRIDVPAFLVGGDGDDHLRGGDGDDLIVGGDGDDTIDGNGGRDVLFGVLGADLLRGGAGDDLQFGGITAYDGDPAALKKVRDVWSAPLSYNARVDRLRNGTDGVPGLDVTTVTDDQDKDRLFGETGLDWFWAGILDKVDKKSGEQLGPPAP
jgi:Ca2+-binding RTX toxin-like protein